MKVFYTIFAILLATAILLSANHYLSSLDLTIHSNTFINALFKYQSLAFLIALSVLFITLKISPESKQLLKIGNLKTIATKEKWLGINGQTSWKSSGLQLLFFVSIATGIFMFLGVKHTNSLCNFKWAFIPLVLFISFANSFSEEIIYRFAINGNLSQHYSKLIVLITSALLFGLPHYMGYPSGVVGVMMAGLLGYILSKATYETKGLGIAWAIHFVQDVIIFTALFMMNVKV